MAVKNSINNLEGGLALFGLIGLLFVATVTVSSLNPIVEQEGSNINSASVAGISTETSSIIPLSIKNTFEDYPPLEIGRIEVQDSVAAYSIVGENITKSVYSGNLFSIYNPNNAEVKTKVKFILPDALKGKVKVYLEDEKDSLIMYTREESYGPKTVTLDKFGERNFRFRIEILEDLPSVEMVFLLADGR